MLILLTVLFTILGLSIKINVVNPTTNIVNILSDNKVNNVMDSSVKVHCVLTWSDLKLLGVIMLC